MILRKLFNYVPRSNYEYEYSFEQVIRKNIIVVYLLLNNYTIIFEKFGLTNNNISV